MTPGSSWPAVAWPSSRAIWRSPRRWRRRWRPSRRGVAPEWFSHLVVDPAAGEVVGFGGFKGPPRDGEVEVGYSVAPSRRGRGHATAAVLAFLEWAGAHGVHAVCAHTLPEENPSTGVLRRCGFVRAGEAVDPGVGPVWRWERRLAES